MVNLVEFFFEKNLWGPLQPSFFHLASGEVSQIFPPSIHCFFWALAIKERGFLSVW